jgi:hypothetical protein
MSFKQFFYHLTGDEEAEEAAAGEDQVSTDENGGEVAVDSAAGGTRVVPDPANFIHDNDRSRLVPRSPPRLVAIKETRYMDTKSKNWLQHRSFKARSPSPPRSVEASLNERRRSGSKSSTGKSKQRERSDSQTVVVGTPREKGGKFSDLLGELDDIEDVDVPPTIDTQSPVGTRQGSILPPAPSLPRKPSLRESMGLVRLPPRVPFTDDDAEDAVDTAEGKPPITVPVAAVTMKLIQGEELLKKLKEGRDESAETIIKLKNGTTPPSIQRNPLGKIHSQSSNHSSDPEEAPARKVSKRIDSASRRVLRLAETTIPSRRRPSLRVSPVSSPSSRLRDFPRESVSICISPPPDPQRPSYVVSSVEVFRY